VLGYLVFGISYAFAAVVQPGPLQAWAISRTLAHGWRRGLPAAFSPLVSDGPIIVFALLVLSRMPAWLLPGIRITGGAVLLVFAMITARDWWRARAGAAVAPAPAGSAPRSLFAAAAVNFTSPGPYLGWMLVMGPLLLRGWRESPAHGLALLGGFYGTMVAGMVLIVALVAATRRFGAGLQRGLLGASALALLGLGAAQIYSGFTTL
jgi:threonine/homoserine/homoserine lactone efflux protein